MIAKAGSGFDIILVSGEYYDDHPLSPVGIIARVLDAKGYRVGVIEKPVTPQDFTKLGAPRLCFAVTSGSIDSMLNNYTPMKHRRSEDSYAKPSAMPDRAVIVYCQKLKAAYKETPLVIGGIEASLRRFAHYDYWENRIRRSILFDSRATILVYGNGEKQIEEIAKRLSTKQSLLGIEGTCIVNKTLEDGFEVMPSFDEVDKNPVKFCEMQRMFSNDRNLAQPYTNNYVLQYHAPRYTTKDLDDIYSLPFTRMMHPKSLLKMAQFSIVTHRGCIGRCNFCSLALHQGDRIVSRSEDNILQEIRRLTKHPQFKGYIDDLGGPSANMYGMDCPSASTCQQACLACKTLDCSHGRLLSLLRKARQIPGVKKIFIRSGIRYDLALRSPQYITELSQYHISGCLKIAPEHLSPQVLKLMNKEAKGFDEFIYAFTKHNPSKKQALRYYFMVGHPGDTEKETLFLKAQLQKKKLSNLEQFQLFTPTPMTPSTCMYWTKRNPFTMEPVQVVCDYKTKKQLKRILLETEKSPRKR
jgi:uncharacterized radical SAM protein YgiQ